MSEFVQLVSSYPFLQNALLASVFTSVICGIIGTLIVCNRLTFLAGATSHAAYGGIGLALFLGLPLLPCTIAFTLTAAMLMGWLTHKSSKQSHAANHDAQNMDAAIGVLWAAGMAFGIILIELSPAYSGELMGFLFGNILTVPTADVFALILFSLFLIAITYLLRQGLWAVSLDYDYAQSRGLPVTFLSLGIIALTAISVVLLIRIVGLILVLAMLTIPASLARTFCTSFFGTMICSSCLCLIFCLCGLTLSWYTNLSSGSVIIAFASACYLLCHGIQLLKARYNRQSTTIGNQ